MRSIVFAVALLVLVSPNAASAQAPGPLDLLARQLIATMASNGGLTPAPRIAVYPFDPADIAVSRDDGRQVSDGLVRALVSEVRGRANVVTRENFEQILREIREFGANGLPTDNAVAALRDNNRLDVIVLGRIVRSPQGQSIEVSFEAVRLRDSVVLGAAAATMPLPAGAQARTLDAALEEAGRHFRQNVPDAIALTLGGLRCEEKGTDPTGLGAAIQERAVGAIRRAYSSVLTPRAFVMNANPPRTPGEYRLSGTYWGYPEFVQLILRLEGARGEFEDWEGKIWRTDLPLGKEPECNGFGPSETDRTGRVGMTLDTGQGRAPFYRIGDTFDLRITLDRDAWVSCFVVQGQDKALVRLFPNKHATDARLSGRQLHTLPGTLGFAIKVQPPAGTDLVKCFASERDLATNTALPAPVRDLGVEVLPDGMYLQLQDHFRRIPGVTERHVMVNTVE